MDKLARRVAHAQRSASRRAQLLSKRDQLGVTTRNRGAIKDAVNEVRQNIRDARQARREDWEMGPLAPKRDLGFNNYGVVQEPMRQDWTNHGLVRGQFKLAEKRCAWAGGSKQLNLAPGDRIVVMEGQDKGKIDRIKTVNAANGTITLENHNRALVKSMLNQPARSQAMPLPVDCVRLVYPLADPDTGVTRDVIIRQLKAVPPNMQSANMTLDRWRYGQKWDRIVPALNKVIPWPETVAPVFETNKADTARDTVEERTFYYSLTAPPMPEGVIDELRNKYSKFRTRHEEWYVTQKEAEAEAEHRRKETVRSMQTPLEEFNEMQRALRDAEGEPELSEEMLAKIGEVMAKSKAAALETAGVSEVASKQ